jgi:hypothetical protein
MGERTKKVVEWIEHGAAVHALAQTEFVRTILLPLVVAGVTGGAGYLGGQPIMWIMMAGTLVFMGTMQGLLRWDEYRERKTPLNKLTVLGPQFSCALNTVPAPTLVVNTRQTRRAAQRGKGGLPVPQQEPEEPRMLSAAAVHPLVMRTIDNAQIGVGIKNTALFPISILLAGAKTEIGGLTPPRSDFPKAPSTLSPGAAFTIMDDIINMAGAPCGRLAGKLDMRIKYGLPGREKFELRLEGDIDVVMERFGLITQVGISWRH